MLWWDIFDATGKLEVESEVKRRLVVFYTYMAIKKGTCLFVLHFNLLKFNNLSASLHFTLHSSTEHTHDIPMIISDLRANKRDGYIQEYRNTSFSECQCTKMEAR